MKIIVSELCLSDRQDWEVLYYGYAEFYEVPMNQEILDAVWAWIFDAKKSFYALIAKSGDGKAHGIMHYREMASPLRGKFVGFLDDLYVNPKSRGQGVVDALFQALFESAKSKGWPYVRWITAENNYRARRVYDKIAEKTQWITYQLKV